MFQHTTERIVISPFTMDDGLFILELLNTASWLQYIGDRGVKNLKDAQNYLSTGPIRSYEQFGFGLYKVSLLSSQPIGMCGLIKRPELETPDIGFALLPTYEGQGYAYEAASAVMGFAMNSLRLPAICGITTSENPASAKLLQKLGLKFNSYLTLHPEGPELMLFLRELHPEKAGAP
ncbi:GNAT family N-acetyltransferase [Telluribacter humicola]|uniref:GNAT family N-acetyltransferase n=1 Tax=Telluribacter humicola TaxID=1720261 RepID=UPI001A962039|nr:GNAT family N-acetyltransferase [Telluribacter humicola]